MASRLVPRSGVSRIARHHTGRLRVMAAFQCPYSTLGVSASADEVQIKKAYRKLALEWHPDVSKHEGAQTVFLQLTEAYDFLSGKLNGKEAKDPLTSNDWDFHDWYWSFRISRTWAKQQKSESGETAPPRSSSCGGSSSSRQAGGNRANLHHQLAGLRKRAAARMSKSNSCSSMSTMSMDDSDDEGSGPSAAAAWGNPVAMVDAYSHGTCTQGTPPHQEQEQHVEAGAAPEPVGSDQAPGGRQDAWAEPAANVHAASADGGASARRKFVAHSGTREQVFSQLAGLRRKASLAKQL